jgi:hypothetical protein
LGSFCHGRSWTSFAPRVEPCVDTRGQTRATPVLESGRTAAAFAHPTGSVGLASFCTIQARHRWVGRLSYSRCQTAYSHVSSFPRRFPARVLKPSFGHPEARGGGAPRGAPLIRAGEARRAPCDRDARSSALRLAIFWFGSALLPPALPPEVMQRAPRGTGRSARRAGSEPPEPALRAQPRERQPRSTLRTPRESGPSRARMGDT